MQTVLVVDDESNMRFLTRMILENAGYTVIEAPHGAAALERAKETRPDLVVTDLMMPVMGGHELVERLRSDPDTATIPIVVLSANSGSVRTTADSVLGKPFEPELLIATARTLAGRDGG